MPILRTLLFEAVKRAAMNPKVRAQAGRIYKQDVQPHLTTAARKGRSAASQLGNDWRGASAEADPKRHPARFAGRLAGRLRKHLRSSEEGS